LRLLSIALLVSACATTKPAPHREPTGPLPDVHDETVFYDVDGSTSAELRSALDAKGPTDESGRHDALTKWYVNWTFDYLRGDGSCGLTHVKATLKSTFTVPRWSGDISSPLGARWQHYLDALWAHERGHAQNGVDAARYIVESISLLPSAADCDAAANAANATGDRELELARERDRAYDAETKHGATQGATFR
jgi:predicted secreted Zn-dependent protease